MTQSLREWFQAIAVLTLTLITVGLVRSALRRFRKDRTGVFLSELAPSISNLIYIFGFKLFVEISPLGARTTSWLEGIIYILAVVILLSLVRRAAMVTIEWSAFRSSHSTTLQHGFIPLMRNVITLFVFFAGAIMVLKHFNYDVMSLLTALGVGSLAVGLAAKDTLSNMISGFTLIIDRNLRPGDRINLSGSVGDVEEIGLRSTRIRMGDGNTLIVPNADLVNTKIMNLSLPSRETACSTSIRVPIGVPFERVQGLCLGCIDEVGSALPGRRWANLSSLADGHQLISIGFWVRDLDLTGEALSQYHQLLLRRLAASDIHLVTGEVIKSV